MTIQETPVNTIVQDINFLINRLVINLLFHKLTQDNNVENI